MFNTQGFERMAIFRANTQQDGYCYLCRKNTPSEKLKKCQKCNNWFCEKHISLVLDPEVIIDVEINLCDKDQGKPSF
ncbi:MAG: hypothetical protein HYT62_04915 [Candidatus Yanofskybacteria bacterium]|nr:hypothetical protein [Candidatus Yanofskybacteria bacterium]